MQLKHLFVGVHLLVTGKVWFSHVGIVTVFVVLLGLVCCPDSLVVRQLGTHGWVRLSMSSMNGLLSAPFDLLPCRVDCN